MEKQEISKTLRCGPNSIYSFNLSDLIGKGSQAKVYKGVSKNRQKVAIKIYQKTTENASSLKEQFQRLSKLNHPNIVKLHQCIQTEHNIYYVMDLYNSDLDVYISTYRLDSFSVMNIFTQILGALVYLQSSGILYQDLSLKNVLIKNNIPYLSDINIDPKNLLINNLFCPPQLLKSKLYLPSKVYDQKSLAWSLGIFLYYMLFQKFPFPIKVKIQDHIENLNKYLNPSIVLDQSVKLEFPAASEILLKCLTYKKEDRAELFTLNKLQCLRKYKMEPSIFKSVKVTRQLSTVSSDSSMINAESSTIRLYKKNDVDQIKPKFNLLKSLRQKFEQYVKVLKAFNIKLKVKVTSLCFLVLCKIRLLLQEITVFLAENKSSHEAYKNQLNSQSGYFNKYFQSFKKSQLVQSQITPEIFQKFSRQVWSSLKQEHQSVQSSFYQLLQTFQSVFDIKVQKLRSDSVQECVTFYLGEIKKNV